jgi:hypothetical protein
MPTTTKNSSGSSLAMVSATPARAAVRTPIRLIQVSSASEPTMIANRP